MNGGASPEAVRLLSQARAARWAAVAILVLGAAVAVPQAIKRRGDYQAANDRLVELQEAIVNTQARILGVQSRVEGTQAKIRAALNGH
jgi:uncharacterized protein YlxW (UPF0749 family)